MSGSVSPACAVCGGSGSVYVGDHDGAPMYATCDCTKPAVSPPTPEPHESDQSRYASECDLCETDGTMHMWECPNNPLRATRPARDEYRPGQPIPGEPPIIGTGNIFVVEWLRAALVVAEAARNTAEQDADRLAEAMVAPALVGIDSALEAHAAAVAGRVVPTGPEAT